MAAAHVSGLVALYIAADGRAHSAAEVYQLRQTLIDSAQPQSAWQTADTLDPDGNQEGLAIASLSWIPRMKFLSAKKQPAGFEMNFSTLPGYTHTVQSHTNATATNAWSTLTTTNGTGSPATVVDPITNTARYYRLETPPAP